MHMSRTEFWSLQSELFREWHCNSSQKIPVLFLSIERTIVSAYIESTLWELCLRTSFTRTEKRHVQPLQDREIFLKNPDFTLLQLYRFILYKRTWSIQFLLRLIDNLTLPSISWQFPILIKKCHYRRSKDNLSFGLWHQSTRIWLRYGRQIGRKTWNVH